MFDALIARGFQFEFASHAKAILTVDFPDAIDELTMALDQVSIPIEEIIGSGGGEAKGTQRLRRALADLGWPKAKFVVEKTVNGRSLGSTSHEVDHVRAFEKGVVALEIEWNNKDPFFDRDLENFKRLHADGAISLGVIVTRGSGLQDSLTALIRRFADERSVTGIESLSALSLNPTKRQQADYERRVRGGITFQEAWSTSFVQDKFGQATTHWRKLDDRLHRGVGNPCPLILVGLPASIVTFGEDLDVERIVGGDDAAIG
ncbi:MAG TPA: BglII/BstYI family type II restriction endonuclease [Polyangia bacterium]|nr:BglII/BstYI family type II restriction endonuclease [Polyangia bacterium]